MKPRPTVEIVGSPIIWYIMKIYSYYGINDMMNIADIERGADETTSRSFYHAK